MLRAVVAVEEDPSRQRSGVRWRRVRIVASRRRDAIIPAGRLVIAVKSWGNNPPSISVLFVVDSGLVVLLVLRFGSLFALRE
jgi:hypothetical protein